jgi:hypothetical protein
VPSCAATAQKPARVHKRAETVDASCRQQAARTCRTPAYRREKRRLLVAQWIEPSHHEGEVAGSNLA